MEASLPSFSSCFFFFFLLLLSFFPLAQPVSEQACISPIESLLDCLSYTQGKAQVPTPTCCSNMKTVFQSQKECLCELIVVSAQGQATGLPPMNQTLALNLPVACGLPANPSQCPGLLGISPSSPEAQIFNTAATNSTSVNGTSKPLSQTKGQSSALTASPKNGATISVSPNFPWALVGAAVILLKLTLPVDV